MDRRAANSEVSAASHEAPQRVGEADAAPHGSGDGRAHEAELGQRTPTEDQRRVEDAVQPVGEDQDPHRDRGIPCAAEHRVDEEQQERRATAQQRDAREVERKKVGLHCARRRKQFSKR